MSQPLKFETPDRPVWPLVLALLVAWLGFICTAEAQTSEPPSEPAGETKEVVESSPCNKILQVYMGLQLISVQIDPESLQSVAIYYRKLPDGRILLFRLIRPSCEEPWRQAGVKVLAAPVCVETDTTKCL